MNDDETLELAKRSGVAFVATPTQSKALLEFARRVRKEEREACAKIADFHRYGFTIAASIADNIRKRSNVIELSDTPTGWLR